MSSPAMQEMVSTQFPRLSRKHPRVQRGAQGKAQLPDSVFDLPPTPWRQSCEHSAEPQGEVERSTNGADKPPSQAGVAQLAGFLGGRRVSMPPLRKVEEEAFHLEQLPWC